MRNNRMTASVLIAAGLLGGSCMATAAWAAEPAAVKVVQGDPYQQLAALDFGAGDEIFTAINKDVVDAKPDQYPEIEKKLIQVLQAKDATLASRQFACRMLRIAGSQACVPVVAGLLGDEKLSHIARYALAGLPYPSVDVALHDALAKTSGNLRLGIVNTLGDRHDVSAVPLLAKLIGGGDDAATVVVLRAIGRIGSREAADALRQAKVAASVTNDWYEARLLCGQGMLTTGQTADAHTVYSELTVAPAPAAVRAAALVGLVRADREKALPAVLEALKASEKVICQAGSAAVIELREPAVTATFAKELPGMPAGAKVAMLHALAARGLREGLTDTINKLVNDAEPTVGLAALAALRPLGDASSVPVLAGALKNNALAAEATLTLKMVFADGVVAQLIKQAEAGDVDTRVTIIGILGDRHEAEALPLVVKLAGDADRKIRLAAIKTVGTLGGDKEVEPMLGTMLKSTDNGERDALQQAISAIARRNTDLDARCQPMIKAMAGADQAVQIQLLNILASLGGGKSLECVRGSLASNVPDVKRAALRAMTDWTDDAPMVDLQTLAKNDADQPTRILALRGYIRLIGLPKNRRANQAVSLYTQAMELATRPEEKRQVLGGMANVRHLDALKFAQGYIADAGLRREALNAALKIANDMGNARNAKDVRPIVEQIMAGLTDNDADFRRRANDVMDKLSR